MFYFDPGVVVKDFILEAKFHNPTRWGDVCGAHRIEFRFAGEDEYFEVAAGKDDFCQGAEFRLFYCCEYPWRASLAGTPNMSDGATNTFRLEAKGEVGMVSLNGGPQNTLDLRRMVEAGQIILVTTDHNEEPVIDLAVQCEITIWSLDP
jgi:hypothetical protein